MTLNEIFDYAEQSAKALKPFTGYTLHAVQAVRLAAEEGRLPDGTNIAEMIALQFDGVEDHGDVVSWGVPEWQIPYGDSPSLDKSEDCSEFWRRLFLLLFDPKLLNGFTGASWTVAQWNWAKKNGRIIPWEQRRPLDLVYYNFKRGREVSHVGGLVKHGLLHTRSKSKALMVTSEDYAAGDRVGVVRVLDDNLYNALIYHASGAQQPTQPQKQATYTVKPGDALYEIALKYGTSVKELAMLNGIANPSLIYPGQIIKLGVDVDKPEWTLGRVLQYKDEWGKRYMAGPDVEDAQIALKDMGYNPGQIDGEWGPRSKAAFHLFQLDHPECGTKGKPDDKLGRKSCEKLGGVWIGK